MNTDTGAILRLHPELVQPVPSGRALTPRDFRKLPDHEVAKLAAQDREAVEETLRAWEAVKDGAPIVRVADEVAHAQRLGQRELARRQRRRRARRS